MGRNVNFRSSIDVLGKCSAQAVSVWLLCGDTFTSISGYSYLKDSCADANRY